MKTRVLTSIAMLIVVFIPLVYGGLSLKVLGCALVIAATVEWMSALENYSKWKYWVLPQMIAWIFCLFFIEQAYMTGYWIMGIVYVWTLPIFHKDISQNDAMYIIAFQIIFGLFWIVALQLFDQHQYLWTLCLATYGSDTGAYLSGCLFGKHKMVERISPKKTWEGLAGGWICGFLLSFGFSFLYLQDVNPNLNFALCLLAPLFAELGDLCFSGFKRAKGIKDFSNFLPGHGGIIDRIDSLLMNVLLFGFLYSIF